MDSTAWYFAGKPVTGPRFIALGRRNWYTSFANQLTKQLGTKVYLCDFMDWIDESRPEKSLYFFIDTSERIDVNLKGIPTEDLKRATVGAGRNVYNRGELRLPYMTGWEINQLFHRGHIAKTYWHTCGSMTTEEAYRAMGRKVPIDRILDTSLNKQEYLGSTRMTAEMILSKYRQEGIKSIENLLKKIMMKSWSKNLIFCDSSGTLILAVHGQKTNEYTGMLEISVHHEDVFIVQVYDSDNRVTLWNRNSDIQAIGRILIALMSKSYGRK